MICEHLQQLEQEIIQAGFEETCRGQVWSDDCREWVYFDCYLDRESIKKRFNFQSHVVEHQHRGTHDGEESGFICKNCQNAIMGHYSAKSPSKIFK